MIPDKFQVFFSSNAPPFPRAGADNCISINSITSSSLIMRSNFLFSSGTRMRSKNDSISVFAIQEYLPEPISFSIRSAAHIADRSLRYAYTHVENFDS